jgi:hypothetical protein
LAAGIFSSSGIAQDKVTPAELTRQADVVVRARVESKTVRRDLKGRIVTEIELSQRQLWKGESSAPVRVISPGGVLGEQRTVSSGQADYALGEKVVLFLVKNKAGAFVTVGMSHGKFSIRTKNGTEFAINPEAAPVSMPVSELKNIVLQNQ